MDETNNHDIENEENTNDLEQTPNVDNVDRATVEQKQGQQSSQYSTMSSKHLLSEFDDTIDYPFPNSSQNSSNGSSAHSDENDKQEGDSAQNVAIQKKKLDSSLKPKLITPSQPLSNPCKRNHKQSGHTYSKHTWRQPSRAKTEVGTCLPDTDDSSIESDDDTKDGNFITEGVTGKFH